MPLRAPLRAQLLALSVLATLGCSPAGLLYPGDEQSELPSGYGLMAIGAEPSMTFYTLEVCQDGDNCLIVGPFMQQQEAYLVRLPIGKQCLTAVRAKALGSIEGGGSGGSYTWRSDQCFTVREGGVTYVGSFNLVDERLHVGVRLDIIALLKAHYPDLRLRGAPDTQPLE